MSSGSFVTISHIYTQAKLGKYLYYYIKLSMFVSDKNIKINISHHRLRGSAALL